MNRREILLGASATAMALAAGPSPAAAAPGAPISPAPARRLEVVKRNIEVGGKAAQVYGLVGPEGGPGLRFLPGEPFSVSLVNATADPTIIHWHGLTPPWPQDGVQDAPMPLLAARASRSFDFALEHPGTYWMHAHTPQQQALLTAPLIVEAADDPTSDARDVVLLLNDFSFKSAGELLAALITKGSDRMGGMDMGGSSSATSTMSGMDMGTSGDSGMSGMNMSSSGSPSQPASGGDRMAMDINDIDFDAYLANDRTLDDPEVVAVDAGGRVRLRIINGSAATAYTLNTGELDATVLAVDGQDVRPVSGRSFPLSMGQRVDLLLSIPNAAGAFPILALREGARERTGIILRSKSAAVAKIAPIANTVGPVLDLGFEATLRATAPLTARKPDKTFDMQLTGDMANYRWGLETSPALIVDSADRVEITFRNVSMMAHPMHLHGHRFQVVAIDWKRFAGPMRDTVLVPPLHAVTIAVDAINPGQWAFHCHHLYHMESGMMTTFSYRA